MTIDVLDVFRPVIIYLLTQRKYISPTITFVNQRIQSENCHKSNTVKNRIRSRQRALTDNPAVEDPLYPCYNGMEPSPGQRARAELLEDDAI